MLLTHVPAPARAPSVADDATTIRYKQLDYKDRHGAFMEMHGQWYFSTNDLSHSADKASPNSYVKNVVQL